MTAEQLKYISEAMAFTERQIYSKTGLKVSLDVKGTPLLREGIADPSDMVDKMAEAMGFFPEKIKVPGRQRELVMARNACIYLLHSYFPKITLTAIGKLFNKDHSSIIYAIDTAGKDLETKNEQFIGLYVKAENAAEDWYDKFKKEVLCGKD